MSMSRSVLTRSKEEFVTSLTLPSCFLNLLVVGHTRCIKLLHQEIISCEVLWELVYVLHVVKVSQLRHWCYADIISEVTEECRTHSPKLV